MITRRTLFTLSQYAPLGAVGILLELFTISKIWLDTANYNRMQFQFQLQKHAEKLLNDQRQWKINIVMSLPISLHTKHRQYTKLDGSNMNVSNDWINRWANVNTGESKKKSLMFCVGSIGWTHKWFSTYATSIEIMVSHSVAISLGEWRWKASLWCKQC